MALSGSTDFAENTRQIARDALVTLGVEQPGKAPDHERFQFAQRQLNRIIKAWQAKGYNLWRTTEGAITLVADQQSYTMGGTTPDFSIRPLRIEQMRFVQADGTESPIMIPVAREYYFSLPQKGANGTSTQYYYDPGRAQGTLYIWPVLSSVTTEQIKFTYQRSFDDFDAALNEPDVPQEWFDVLVKTLAAQLAVTYFPDQVQLIGMHKALAMEAMDLAQGFDAEWADIQFVLGEDDYR